MLQRLRRLRRRPVRPCAARAICTLGRVSSRLALALFATSCALFAVIGVFAISRINSQADAPAVVHSAESPFRGGSMPSGVHAPEFTLTDQNGTRVSMAEYRGKPVVV